MEPGYKKCPILYTTTVGGAAAPGAGRGPLEAGEGELELRVTKAAAVGVELGTTDAEDDVT
ncbi:hypothetical protein FACS189472_09410 [Alphaproteobacteria bacterium]|nr:hypothetical protein FACS189472_09410 [Alphaproteobacteria bacterium]